jgi:hypothetical protein
MRFFDFLVLGWYPQFLCKKKIKKKESIYIIVINGFVL